MNTPDLPCHIYPCHHRPLPTPRLQGDCENVGMCRVALMLLAKPELASFIDPILMLFGSGIGPSHDGDRVGTLSTRCNDTKLEVRMNVIMATVMFALLWWLGANVEEAWVDFIYDN